MRTFWIISAIFFTVCVIISYKRNRQILTVYNAVYLMTLGNFYLYLQRWSGAFVYDCYSETYYVMAVVCLVFGCYALLDNKKEENLLSIIKLKSIGFGNLQYQVSTVLLIICLALTAVENIYNTGALFASDYSTFHIDSMPIIGTIVRGLYPVAYGTAYIDFKNNKKLTTLILTALCIMYALLGAGSRYWSSISILTGLIFIFESNRHLLKQIKARYRILFFLLAFLLLTVFINLGEGRTGTHTYAEWIQYTGPFRDTSLEVVASWFYGYFPFSFYNLNNTLHNILNENICTYGQFALYPFLAIMHIDDFVGIDVNNLEKSCRVIVNTAATVPTGWYQFFADFGYLFIFDLVFRLLFTYYFEKKRNFFGMMSFSTMFCAWSLLAFNDVFLSGIYLYVIIFSFFIQKIFVYNI